MRAHTRPAPRRCKTRCTAAHRAELAAAGIHYPALDSKGRDHNALVHRLAICADAELKFAGQGTGECNFRAQPLHADAPLVLSAEEISTRIQTPTPRRACERRCYRDRWAFPGAAAHLVDQYRLADVLDYGCGKQSLARALIGISVRGYDPSIVELSAIPTPAIWSCAATCSSMSSPRRSMRCSIDLVRLHAAHGRFWVIATRPARKILADGRNAAPESDAGQPLAGKSCNSALRSPSTMSGRISKEFEELGFKRRVVQWALDDVRVWRCPAGPRAEVVLPRQGSGLTELEMSLAQQFAWRSAHSRQCSAIHAAAWRERQLPLLRPASASGGLTTPWKMRMRAPPGSGLAPVVGGQARNAVVLVARAPFGRPVGQLALLVQHVRQIGLLVARTCARTSFMVLAEVRPARRRARRARKR